MFFSKLFSSSSYHLSSSSTSLQSLSKILSLQNLLKSGFTPTIKTLNQFLSFLFTHKKFNFVFHFFCQITSNDISPTSLTHSILTKSLIKANRLTEAEAFVAHMLKTGHFPPKGIWDSLIQGYCSIGKTPEKALSLLKDCLKIPGISPSRFTFSLLIHRFSSLGNMDRAIEVLELMTSENFRHPFGNFVCSSVISGFCKIGKPELALGFYENAKKVGALRRPNVVTYTSIVNALCKEGKIDEVRGLVERMEKEKVVLDAVFYSSWICGYFKEGVLEEVFRKHRVMLDEGIKPDVVSYTILIDGFSKEGNVNRAVGFLNEMKKDKLEPNLITYTAIMRGFCQGGKVEEAFDVFRTMEKLGIKVDEVTYSTLIDGLCRKGDFDQVFMLLDEMENNGISIGIITYNTVINGLCKVGRTTEADQISKNMSGDNYTYSTLLHGYVKENNVVGMLETKKRLEESDFCMDVIMCNVLIKALFMVGALADVRMIFKGMPQMGLVANRVTYCTMIDGYFKVSMISEALEIFEECKGTSSISDIACYNSTIFGLCENFMVDMAIDVFVELIDKHIPNRATYMVLIKSIFKERNAEGVVEFIHKVVKIELEVVSIMCSDVIQFFCKKGHMEAGLEVYLVTRKIGVGVTSNCYYSMLEGLLNNENKSLIPVMLNAYLKDYGFYKSRIRQMVFTYLCEKDVNKALHFLNMMNDKQSSDTIPAATIEALAKDGRALDAYKLVVEAKSDCINLDVVSYSIVVDGLCKEGHLSKALALCANMREKGVAPNIITYNSVINRLCQEGCLSEALRLFDSLEKISLPPTGFTYGSLISGLCREGYLQNANQLLQKMVLSGIILNTRVYNPLIDGYCKCGLLEEALSLLLAMDGSFCTPDAFTVSAIIDGYCRKGDMEGALVFYFEYKSKGTLPDLLGFLCLIKGLCIKGRMEEARNIFQEMLHNESVTEVINRAGGEVETDPLASILVFLCEQGRIEEATSILGEVGSLVFPSKRRYSGSLELNDCNRRETLNVVTIKSHTSINDVEMTYSEGRELDCVFEGNHNSRQSLVNDFDDVYSLVASLCSQGEIEKANQVAKGVFLNGQEVTG